MLRTREMGEDIEPGDLCRTITGEMVPASASIGRKVSKENVNWVYTHKPHTKESQAAQAQRARETGEVYG